MTPIPVEQVLPATPGWRAVTWGEILISETREVRVELEVAPVIGWLIQREDDGIARAKPIVARKFEGQVVSFNDIDHSTLGYLEPGAHYDEAEWMPLARAELDIEAERRQRAQQKGDHHEGINQHANSKERRGAILSLVP